MKFWKNLDKNKARRKFCKFKNWYKNPIEIVYLDNSYKNPFDRKMPQSQLETPFSRQGWLVSFSVYGFFTKLLVHILLRFLAEFCFNTLFLALFLLKWHRMRLYEKCAKSQRHLWTGCTSSCHPELDSGSINKKKFQNFFIVFAKKCNFFSIIKMYKKNYFWGEKLWCILRNLKI